MSSGVKVVANHFVSIEFGGALVELSKDEDSPACPSSWTWLLFYDGNLIDSDSEETSFVDAVLGAAGAIDNVMGDLDVVKGYLLAAGSQSGEREGN